MQPSLVLVEIDVATFEDPLCVCLVSFQET
jgi:hypothetical protein